MRSFEYRRAADRTEAVSIAGAEQARYLGGGTNLVDLMRQNIEAPAALVDVSRLPGTIENTPNGGLLIGAAVRNNVVAAHPAVRTHYPMLSRALLAGAAGGRFGADPQHGDRRRQHPPADALRLFPRSRDALQQTRTWKRLLRNRRL